MSDKNRHLQIKYPDGRYHNIIVTNLLKINNDNRELLLVFYNDRTISLNDSNNSTFALLKKENNTFTHLYCENEYDKIKEDLWPFIYEKKCEVLDINILPDAIDEVIEYDYFNTDSKEESVKTEEKVIDNNILKKSIYVIWNMKDELLFYEYNAYVQIDDMYTYRFDNISINYKEFIVALLKYIKSYNLVLEDNKLIKTNGEELGTIALNRKKVSYEFNIIACDNERYNSLIKSDQIFIDTNVIDFPKYIISEALVGNKTLITLDTTYYSKEA